MIVKVFRVQCSGPCGLWLSLDGPVLAGYPDICEFDSSLVAAWHAWAAGWRRPSMSTTLFEPEHMYCPGYREGGKSGARCVPVPSTRACRNADQHVGDPGEHRTSWLAVVRCPACEVALVWERAEGEG